jgi:diguanylate cyclase (GGDEF)-like protein
MHRRRYVSAYALEWETAVREGTLLGCMTIDADGFKVINDTRGHDAGDAMLRALSKQCQNWCRRPDQTPGQSHE